MSLAHNRFRRLVMATAGASRSQLKTIAERNDLPGIVLGVFL